MDAQDRLPPRARHLPETFGLEVDEPDAHLPAHLSIARDEVAVLAFELDIVAHGDVHVQVLEEAEDLPGEKGMGDDGPLRRRAGGEVIDLDEDLAPRLQDAFDPADKVQRGYDRRGKLRAFIAGAPDDGNARSHGLNIIVLITRKEIHDRLSG